MELWRAHLSLAFIVRKLFSYMSTFLRVNVQYFRWRVLHTVRDNAKWCYITIEWWIVHSNILVLNSHLATVSILHKFQTTFFSIVRLNILQDKITNPIISNMLMTYSNLVVLTMRISFPSASWITRGVVDAMTLLPNDLCLGGAQLSCRRHDTSYCSLFRWSAVEWWRQCHFLLLTV